MARGLVNARSSCRSCLLLVAASAATTQAFFVGGRCPLQARGARTTATPAERQHRTRARAGLSMIIPPAELGYVTEAYDDFPDYVPNMGAWGESKPGNTPEAYPADSLDLDAFWNGGAEAVDFHDIPVVDRPVFVEMKQFIDNEGLTMLPSETELLERDIQSERRARAKARKERFADEPDEDLVDDTLDDLPLDDEIEVGVIDVPPPPVDFDDSDGYDDGYDPDTGDLGGAESDGMY
ncbi:unnamed protein product [Ectocarpus sp. 8 AP-2014]